MALRALVQIAFVDVSAVVADCIRDVEGEVVAALVCGHLEQLPVLLLAQMLVQIHVQRRTSREMLDVLAPVETELIDDVERVVLHDVEVAVVAVTRDHIPVFPVPLGVLHAHIFCRNHLTIEESFLRAVFLIIPFHHAENLLHELGILRIVGDRNSEEFCGFHHAVDADREVLAGDVYVAGVEQRQHALALEHFKVLVVAELNLVHCVSDVLKERDVVHAVLYGVLDTTVEVYGEHGLRAC